MYMPKYRHNHTPAKKLKKKVPKNVKAYVKNVMDKAIEDKQVYSAPGAPQLEISDDLSAAILINGTVQGIGDNQRIGKEITVKFWEAIGYFENFAEGDPVVPFSVRVIALVDHNQNGTTGFDSSTLFPGSVTAGQYFNAPFSLNGQDRYRILMDRYIICNTCTGPIDPNASSFPYQERKTFHYKFNQRIRTTYFTTGAESDDIETNAIWLIFVSENATVPAVRVCVNCVYEDA